MMVASALSARAQSVEVGDTLYSWSPSPLLLYQSPDLSSGLLTTVQPGSKLTVLSDSLYGPDSKKHVVDQCSSKSRYCAVTGGFLHVSTGKDQGYIRSDYLSHLLPPKREYESYKAFFTRNFGEPDSLLMEDEPGGSSLTGFVFKGGIMLQEWHQEGGRVQKISLILPGFSVDETLIMLDHFESLYSLQEEPRHSHMVEVVRYSGGNEHFSDSQILLVNSGQWINLSITRDWE